MQRMFLSITKGDEIRFLGHLDYMRAVERTVNRSGIPIAYSEGFNPHMKINFDAALGVGVAADPLYAEIELFQDMMPEGVGALLVPQLPRGIRFLGGMKAEKEWPKLMAFINYETYELEGPALPGACPESMEESVRAFNERPSFIYRRVTPKKTREMDVRPLLPRPLSVSLQEGRAFLSFAVRRNPAGTVQPRDVWKILAESFAMPWTEGAFVCTRTGAFHEDGDGHLTGPLDPDAFR